MTTGQNARGSRRAARPASKRDAYLALLAEIPLFESLNKTELQDLLSLAEAKRYGRGQIIFSKGDPGDGLYAIVQGRVGIKTVSRVGKEILLNILEPGEVFGEIALLDGKERTAGAVALEPSQLLFLGRGRFMPSLLERPQISLRLIEVLCDRLRWTSDIIEDTVFRDVRSRLAKRLLGLMESYGEAGDAGTRINLKMSQENLGAMLGATRESINKELRRWQKGGVLRQDRGFITVLKPERLAEYADIVS